MPLPDGEDQTKELMPAASDESENGGEPITGGGFQTNIMDRLRAVRDAQTADTTCFIVVPGYKGLLKAEYCVLDSTEMTMIGRKIQRQFKEDGDRQINAIMDILIRANRGLYFVEEDGALTPIDPEDNGRALTYSDPRTATFFNFESDTARTSLLGVFQFNEMSLLAHGLKLNRWYEDTSREVDDDFLGE